MKRYGNLWQKITSFENLLLASKKAQKGKKQFPNVLRFNENLEQELLTLQKELLEQTYQPGDYRTFRIFEPKPRLISAAPYRDRVIHHGLCNIINPLFEKSFIDDSYANRIGYGSHRALRRFTKFYRSSQYVLQCDIKKYFPSIDHEILKQVIHQKIKCQPTLNLIEKIINNSNEQEQVLDYFIGDDLLTPLTRRKGLPLGNLTSQLFANLYLNQFDHFVKEELKAKKYLRYVDDFALFSDQLDYLKDAKIKIEEYLSKFRLKLHSHKSKIIPVKGGVNFLGFRILPDRIRVRNDNLRRARIRFKKMQKDYSLGKLNLKKIIEKIRSWEAHLNHGNTYKLRKSVFNYWAFSKKIF
jgi:RNA-directed DNA polymerase